MSTTTSNSNQQPADDGLRQIQLPLGTAETAEVSFKDLGEGHPVLLLHGGGGPLTVNPFAAKFAADAGARVIVPVHPGFDGTTRPLALDSVRGLAELYVGMLEELGLTEVTVVGNSIGGWIAAEMAILDSPRVSGYVLVDGVGAELPGHEVVDFYSLTPAEVAQHAYHDPERFGIDPSKLPPEALKLMAGNRQALEIYAGATMTDPTLAARLAAVRKTALVVWGEADRIADAEYGRALATRIPGGEFLLMHETGHLPQIETPEALAGVISEFVARTRGL